jgi:hypothetical protein
MFDEDYWNHVSPSCLDPWHWFKQVGYPYTFAGENLAKDFDTSAGVNDGWMNSAGHKANILNTHYTDVGFAVVNGTLPELPDGQVTPSCAPAGTQTNGQTTLVVAHYGATADSVAAATPPSTPAAKPVVAAAATPTPDGTVPAATPSPSASPSPTTSASPSQTPVAVISNHSDNTAAPGSKSYGLFAPLSLGKTLSWPTLVTLGLLGLLLLVYSYTHLAVWRKGLVRWRKMHYKLYAAASVSVLATVIILLATSGFGKVG